MKHDSDHPVKRGFLITASLLALAVVPGCTWLDDMASDWPPQNKQQANKHNRANARSQPRSADSPGAMTETQRDYRYTQMPETSKDSQQRSRQPGANMAGARGLKPQRQSARGTRQRTRSNEPEQDQQLRQRLNRIEKQLKMLRRDFADIKPVMRKVQLAEHQIHQLSRELSRVDTEAAPQPRNGNHRARQSQATQLRSAGKPPMTWQQARRQAQQKARQNKQSAQQTGQHAKPQQKPRRGSARNQKQEKASGVYVKNVRTGTFKGNTRLVLDLSRPAADFSYDLDNRENLLVVEIDGAAWRAQAAQDMSDSDLINSVSGSTTRQGGGRMVVELSEQAKVVRAQKLPPTGNNGYRIFMDLAAK